MLQQTPTDRAFQALGDPTRRAILERLGEGPLSVSALAEPLSISLTAVVQHLRVLEDCGLVRTSKVGRVRSCEIRREGFASATQWIEERQRVWTATPVYRAPERVHDLGED